MTNIAVIRYETKPGDADENHRLVAEVFEQLAKESPDGLRYASFRMDDGVSFMHIAITEGDSDPLPQLSAFQEFQKGAKERFAGAPARGQATLVGSYRFFND